MPNLAHVDVWKLADEIKTLLRKQGELSQNKDSRELRHKLRLIQERIEPLRQECEREFGARHGWKVARDQFSLAQLSENRRSRNRKRNESVCCGCAFDHASCYRLDRQPIAISVQNYNAELYYNELDGVCSPLQLRWQTIEDFPSWHFPGATTLILITRSDYSPRSFNDGVTGCEYRRSAL